LKVIVASGYFDPIHVGHLEYLEKSKMLGDKLIVIVNTDDQCRLKKGEPFMPEQDRLKIVEALSCVDKAILSVDDDMSVCKTLTLLSQISFLPEVFNGVPDVFANGGDRKEEEIPEASVCRDLNIEMVDGLGNKIRSSSEIVEQSLDFGKHEMFHIRTRRQGEK